MDLEDSILGFLDFIDLEGNFGVEIKSDPCIDGMDLDNMHMLGEWHCGI